MQIQDRIAAFRERMKAEHFAVVIVPTADSHASEYIADHFKTRQWLSGFTGSAGTMVVGLEESALFVDGRYFIQAEHQLEGSGVTLMRMGTAGTPTLEEYVASLLHENDALGMDFGVVSERFAENMREKAAMKGALLRDTGDWFSGLWKDRPALPQDKAFILEEKYAGRSVQDKIAAIRNVMSERGAKLHVLNVLDDIAWILNVRGGDVLNTPVVMSYLVIGEKHVNWFVDENKVDDAMRSALKEAGVNIRGYDEIIPALKGLEPDVPVLVDASKLTAALMDAACQGRRGGYAPDVLAQAECRQDSDDGNQRQRQAAGLPQRAGAFHLSELQYDLRLSRQCRDDALQRDAGKRREARAARFAAYRLRRTVSGRHDGYHPHLCARRGDG